MLSSRQIHPTPHDLTPSRGPGSAHGTSSATGVVTGEVGEQVGEQVSEQVSEILRACAPEPKSKRVLLEAAGLANAYLNFKRHILPLLEQGLIEMTIPEKPTSRLQKYRLTAKGKAYLAARQGQPDNEERG